MVDILLFAKTFFHFHSIIKSLTTICKKNNLRFILVLMSKLTLVILFKKSTIWQ